MSTIRRGAEDSIYICVRLELPFRRNPVSFCKQISIRAGGKGWQHGLAENALDEGQEAQTVCSLLVHPPCKAVEGEITPSRAYVEVSDVELGQEGEN